MLMRHYVVRGAVDTDREPLRRFLTTLSLGTWRARFPGVAAPVTDEALDTLLGTRLPGTVVLAVHDTTIVGHAVWALDHTRPDSADLAVVVADAWQRHGIGTRLLDVLVDEMHVLAVTRLTLVTPAANHAGRHLVRRRWPAAVPVVTDGRCTYEIALTDETDQTSRSAA